MRGGEEEGRGEEDRGGERRGREEGRVVEPGLVVIPVDQNQIVVHIL